jgi:energy-coupling factor transporter transmembrane protein EcfT
VSGAGAQTLGSAVGPGVERRTLPTRVRSGLARVRSGGAAAGDVCCCCFAFSLVVAVLCRGWALGVAFALSLAIAALAYPAGLRLLARRRTWILLAMIVVSSTLVGASPVWHVGPFGLSREGAVLGLSMVMRALTIIVAINGLVSSVPVDRLGSVFERVGFRGMGFAVGVAFNLLPLIQHSLATSWQAMRLRAGLRRPLTAVRLMLVAAVCSSLRCADEVVLAAEARAFSAERARGPAFAWRRRTIVLAVVLAVVAALLVWL